MPYTTKELTDKQIHQHAFKIIELLNGLSVAQINNILQEVQHTINATTTLNCHSSEHLAAKQGFLSDSP